MDYSKFLYKIEPLFEKSAQEIKDNISLHDQILSSLDELAVSLRSEFNRDLIRQSSLLSKLLVVKYEASIEDLFSEIVRCLANAVADNDQNREILKRNVPFLLTLKSIVDQFDYEKDADEHFEIGKRSFILLRNLYIQDVPQDQSIKENILNSFYRFTHNNGQALITKWDNEYLLDVTKCVFDLISLFLDDDQLYNDPQFYDKNVPPYSLFVYILNEFALLITHMKDQFDTEVENNEQDNEDYEEPATLTILILTSEIVEKLLKKSVQITGEDDSLHSLSLILDGLGHLENCDFQFPSKLILLRRYSFIIQCMTSNLSLDLSANDYRTKLPFDLTIYSVEKMSTMLLKALDDKQHKNCYQICALSFIIANKLEAKDELKAWKKAVDIKAFISKVCEKFKYVDPYLYIPILDLFRKSISLLDNINDAAVLNSLWNLLENHVHDRLDMISDLSRFYKLLLNKIFAVEYGQTLFDSGVLNFKKIYQSDPVLCMSLVSKLSKPMIKEKKFDELNVFLDTSINGVQGNRSVLAELFKSFGVYIREFSLLENISSEAFYIFDEKEKFLELIKEVVSSKDTQSPATLNNMKFCVGMIISNDNIKSLFSVDFLKQLDYYFSLV
ncbi:uncharacterized protein HGUI_03364 [Hanseniaspora guilliermondii]|uniref:Uncharacterized protein n=1 Tax=Hanseniaspora guilliermondii TaxID=56406 RepID=A0A1L0B5S4_9ASCO|nr:uncharacterized protein HGUI_03364 [Hanseniaspora guilliermondii]